MTLPGPPQFYECPTCKNGIIVRSLRSWNTLRAIWWTDGKPSRCEIPPLVKISTCSQCGNPAWLKKCKPYEEKPAFVHEPEVAELIRLNENRSSEFNTAWAQYRKENRVPRNIGPTGKPFHEWVLNLEGFFLGKDPITQDVFWVWENNRGNFEHNVEEIALCTFVWYLWNDEVRKGLVDTALSNRCMPLTISKVTTRLLELLPSTEEQYEQLSPQERLPEAEYMIIQKSEIYRQMGRFNDCLALLEWESGNENAARWASTIREYAKKKDHILRKEES